MPNVIDLFAGAGGLSLGASRAGFNVVAAVDLDSQANATHINNFPNTRHIEKDIMTLSGEELLRLSNINRTELSGIIGGPPCQGFSSIGHGNVDDVRNFLFVKFFQIVAELQPLFFLAENVPGIMNKKYDAIRTTAFEYVNDYVVLPPITVSANEYGAPTTRTRIFFVGYREGDGITPISVEDIEQMKVPITQRTNVQQALEGLPYIRYSSNCNGEKKLIDTYYSEDAERSQSDFFYRRVVGMRPNGIGNQDYYEKYTQKHIINGSYPTKHSDDVRKRYVKLQYGQRDDISKATRLNPESFCPTLRAGTGPEKGSYQAVRPIHYKYARVITPREAARLQGFPDWFQLPGTIWHGFRQIGNSVSPIVAERILSAINQKLT